MISEIAPGRLSHLDVQPEFGIQFNQFLVKDDEPFLMHTELKKMFPTTLHALASLRWIGFSYFESDECGALNEWFRVAPQARLCAAPSAPS